MLALTAGALGVAAPALASRAPSKSEAAHIRAGALRSLHGKGWHVSHIRVSTARPSGHYSSAAVDNSRTGVGGEMILRRKGSTWRSIFLGTDGFCDAKAPVGVLRDLGFGCGARTAAAGTLSVRPTTVRPGGSVTFTGSGWTASSRVELLIGPPRSEASHVAWARTSAAGAFRKTLRLSSGARPGKYVALACRRACRDKASARLTIAGTGARAAASCEVSLKSTPARPHANTAVTLLARASNCDRITAIVADRAVAGKRRFPCSSGFECTVRVTSPGAQLVHFTAQATSNGKTVKSNEIAVRWSKSKPQAPGKFTMTIKSGGRVVWKGVQDLATGRTTYPVGGSMILTLPGGSRITATAFWDNPISSGGQVLVQKDVWDLASYGASHMKTLCRTTTAGESGCTAKLTLNKRDPDHGHDSQHIHGEGRTATKGYGGWVDATIYLSS